MTLEEIEERRAARRQRLTDDTNARKAIDVEKIDEIEEAHGASNVAVIEVPFTSPDLPVLCAVRTPKDSEIKRYRDTIKPSKSGDVGDSIKAAQQITAVCLVYPDKDTYAKLLAARPGLDVQLGVAALGLSSGRAEEHSKE